MVAPESQQLIQAFSNYRVNNWLSLSTEIVLSDYDQNSISNLDDGNNKGFGHQIKVSGDQIPLFDNIKIGILAFFINAFKIILSIPSISKVFLFVFIITGL